MEIDHWEYDDLIMDCPWYRVPTRVTLVYATGYKEYVCDSCNNQISERQEDVT